MMHDREKSDPAIVAEKPTNKAGQPAAESAEPRVGAEGNASWQSTHRTQGRERVSQALERVRQVARLTVSWLRTLQRRSQKDRTTWQRIAKIASDYLPQPTTLHPWPQMRFAVTHPRWEPRAGIPLARFCAGGGR